MVGILRICEHHHGHEVRGQSAHCVVVRYKTWCDFIALHLICLSHCSSEAFYGTIKRSVSSDGRSSGVTISWIPSKVIDVFVQVVWRYQRLVLLFTADSRDLLNKVPLKMLIKSSHLVLPKLQTCLVLYTMTLAAKNCAEESSSFSELRLSLAESSIVYNAPNRIDQNTLLLPKKLSLNLPRAAWLLRSGRKNYGLRLLVIISAALATIYLVMACFGELKGRQVSPRVERNLGDETLDVPPTCLVSLSISVW